MQVSFKDKLLFELAHIIDYFQYGNVKFKQNDHI